jgi:hypothetical protein
MYQARVLASQKECLKIKALFTSLLPVDLSEIGDKLQPFSFVLQGFFDGAAELCRQRSVAFDECS